MKKIIKSLITLSFLLMISICLFNFNENDVNNVESRIAVSNVENNNYFDDLNSFQTDESYITIAKKTVSGCTMSDFETVSLSEEYTIRYEIIVDSKENSMKLNVYFDTTDEVIIENFIGYPMMNCNDEEDVIFFVDDMRIFLSEIIAMDGLEQCSWFGNILHKTLNAGLLALSYIEPAVKLLAYTSRSAIAILYNSVKNASYLANYEWNKKNTQPTDYVYGQNAYKNWNFGFFNMADRGCEVIAGYNLVKALGRDFSLADTIFMYEGLGVEIGSAQGFFGSNPYQISYFLNATGVSFDRVNNYKTFEKYMKDDSNYYIILSRWNDESESAMIHTFMIDKDCDRNLKFHAYNYSCKISYENQKKTTNTNKYSDYFDGDIKDTYICAYFVKK